MMRSSRSVLLSPPARWTTRRCWSGCECTVFDPLLTQNPKKAGRAGRKQWKLRRVNGGKKHKSEPKRLRFVRETTYGPEGRGFESLTAYQPHNPCDCGVFLIFQRVQLFLNGKNIFHYVNKNTKCKAFYLRFYERFYERKTPASKARVLRLHYLACTSST